VKRVASEVVEQAQNAVATGFEAVKGLGESIVERVSG
jgi:ribosomal protein S17E